MNAKEMIKFLNKNGFYEVRQVGSHKQFKNSTGKTITVPFHGSKDIPVGTAKSIIKFIEKNKQ